MIEFFCPRCESAYQADDRFAGRVVTCRSCGAKIDVNKARAEPVRATKLDESIKEAMQNSANNSDTVSLSFIDDGHKRSSPDDTVVELSTEDLVPTARIPAADAPAPFGDPVKPPKEKKTKSKKEAPQPIIFLDSETSSETVDAILGPKSNLGGGAKDSRPGISRDDSFRGNDETRLDGVSGIVLGLFGVIALAAIARAFMMVGKKDPGINLAEYVGQILTCTIGLFLVLGPMTLLGVFITSRAMRFHLPGASYLRACAAAAAPASLVMLALIFGAPIGLVVMLGMAGLAILVVMIHMTFAMRGGETVLAALASLICLGVGGTAFFFAAVSMAEGMGVPGEHRPVARVTTQPPAVVTRPAQTRERTSIFDPTDAPVARTTPTQTPRTTVGGTNPTPDTNEPAQDESAVPTGLVEAPAAKESWDLKPDEQRVNGEEASFGPFKFFLGDARLDLTDISDPDRSLRFLKGSGGLIFEFVDVTDPSQQVAKIARSHAALDSPDAASCFVIDATGKSKAETGMINGALFTRVEQDGGEIIYATRFDSGWLVARIEDGQYREDLERVVRSVRYASDESPANPLSTEAIIRRLADSPAEAREILIARGKDIEDRLIHALRSRNQEITPGLIEVLDAVGSPKAYDVLFAIARDDLDPSWMDARRTLRKIAPQRFDGVTEAMLDIDSEDRARRDEAVHVLANSTPDERRRESVSMALFELTKSKRIDDIESELGAALAVWKTPATTKYFSETVESEKSDRQLVRIGLAYLGRMRDASFMARISRWAPKEPDAVRNALILAGPMGEGEALLMLKLADMNLRRMAIEVLAEVGTERSLGALEALKNDIELAGAAREAADKIRRRKADRES